MTERYSREDLHAAKTTLQNGGVILYPTDTIWGLGCKISDKESVQKIFDIKGRDVSKKCILLFGSEIQMERYFDEIPEQAWELLECSDNPLTLVLEGGKFPDYLLSADGTIGVRIVEDVFCKQLIQQIKEPIISTSANLSGQSNPKSFSEISKKIKDKVDYVVEFKQKSKTPSKPSSIIKLKKNGEIKILR